MKKSRFTESKIIAILKKHEGGFKVGDICCEHGISQTTSLIGKLCMEECLRVNLKD